MLEEEPGSFSTHPVADEGPGDRGAINAGFMLSCPPPPLFLGGGGNNISDNLNSASPSPPFSGPTFLELVAPHPPPSHMQTHRLSTMCISFFYIYLDDLIYRSLSYCEG